MNILCITHADFESPGVIETWAGIKGYNFNIVRPYKGDTLIKHTDFDFLIIMGGPQSPIELDKDPYLKDEIALIKQAIQDGKLVLGFCLGAQLIGEALGGRTERSPEKEIGVFPIKLSPQGSSDPLLKGLPKDFSVIHWHNDMPGETDDSIVLASSEGCPRQIVKYGPKVYGFQCHLEITRDGIEDLINACPGDLKASRFTQDREQLLSQDYQSINQLMIYLLERFVGLSNVKH
jgi:GMP synthase (glutamine-hydrolysing)